MILLDMVGKMTTHPPRSQDPHILILRTCEYLVLHERSKIVDAIKFSGLDKGRLPWIKQMDSI